MLVGDRLYVMALLGPAVAYVMLLKVIRILTQHTVPGVLGFVDQVRSEVLVNTAFAGVWVGVMAVARGRWGRRLALVVLHCSVLAVTVWATMAHLFYAKTGSPLDWAMLEVAWRSRGEVGAPVAAELSLWYAIWLVLLAGQATVGPWLVTRAILRRCPARQPRHQQALRRPAVAAAAMAISGSLLVPASTAAGFSRDPLLNLVLSPIETRKFSAPPDTAVPTADQLPNRTSLLETTATRRRNVVMVFLESVRAMSTTLGDPTMPTTPFLKELARTSLVAENAYTVVPHTSKALAAAHCGVSPPLDMEATEAKPKGLYARCLPRLLADQGYRSAFFQSATEAYESRAQLVSNLGYDDFLPENRVPKKGFVEANYFGWEDDIMLGPSRSWLSQHSNRPFLASYLTVTSHHDYRVPSSIDVQRLSDDPELNQYLNTIRYQDRFLQRLINQYKELGLYRNTVFVIMADHGEGFGEHGLRQHDNTIYNEGIKIPLLIHDPADRRARTLSTPIQPTSILPTVAEMLGYDVVGGSYPASTLRKPSGEPLRLACFVDDRCLAWISGTEKYIFHFGQRPDEFFDLAEDPHETRNVLAKQDRRKIEAVRADLLRWRAQVRGMTAVAGS